MEFEFGNAEALYDCKVGLEAGLDAASIGLQAELDTASVDHQVEFDTQLAFLEVELSIAGIALTYYILDLYSELDISSEFGFD